MAKLKSSGNSKTSNPDKFNIPPTVNKNTRVNKRVALESSFVSPNPVYVVKRSKQK